MRRRRRRRRSRRSRRMRRRRRRVETERAMTNVVLPRSFSRVRDENANKLGIITYCSPASWFPSTPPPSLTLSFLRPPPPSLSSSSNPHRPPPSPSLSPDLPSHPSGRPIPRGLSIFQARIAALNALGRSPESAPACVVTHAGPPPPAAADLADSPT